MITERKGPEKALANLVAHSEQQRRFYEAILSSTPDLVYVFDLNHRFTYANEALLKMWERPPRRQLERIVWNSVTSHGTQKCMIVKSNRSLLPSNRFAEMCRSPVRRAEESTT